MDTRPLNSNATEEEKRRLEMALLRRQLKRSPLAESLLDKWVPALIAAFALFALVPLASWLQWRGQHRIEARNTYLQKRMEISSHLSSAATQFAQLVVTLDDLYKERQKASGSKVPGLGRDEVGKRIDKLEDERRVVEAKLVESLRGAKLYFGPDAAKQVDAISALYNGYTGNLDEKFVTTFLNKCDKLNKILDKEIAVELKEQAGTY